MHEVSQSSTEKPYKGRQALLSSLKPGEKGTVTAVAESDAVGRRLLEMGIVPGALVKFIKTAPLGDPCEVRILGCNLALRKREADLVEVIIEMPLSAVS